MSDASKSPVIPAPVGPARAPVGDPSMMSPDASASAVFSLTFSLNAVFAILYLSILYFVFCIIVYHLPYSVIHF